MTKQDFRKWNTITGWLLFAIALIVYTMTAEPSLSFWDCGEYQSTSAKLQIGHPPGAPLFQMMGSIFAMFATSPQQTGFMINMVSVLSSAFTILFMFWSVTILLTNIVTTKGEMTSNKANAVLGSAFTASLAFLFSDSFWYNATEAEVYAMASLFIALLFWAGLKWGEAMHEPRGNKWLLLIALLIGLSFGVHFMALLTIPSIGLIYYFKNYKTITVKNFIIANIAIVAVLFFVFKFLLPYTLTLFAKTEIFMVNSMGMPFNSGTIAVALFLIAFFWFGLHFTKKKGLPLYNTALLCILFIMVGFSTWMMLPIRSNANVSINENIPNDAANVLAYYNREQYPEQKIFYGPMYTSAYAGLDKDNPYIDEKPNYERDYKTGRYIIVNNYKNAKQNGDERHNGFMPRMGSDRHTANYMAFAGPPKFRIDPGYDFGRDLAGYGIDVESLEPEEALQAEHQLRTELENVIADFRGAYNRGDLGNDEYDHFLKTYGRYLIIEKPTLGENLSFMVNYQFGYMYWRYLMWNFSGRQSDIQGKNDNINGNWLSGFRFIDEARLGAQDSLTSDMMNNKGRNVYFMLPFLLGVLGAIYHARKDLKSFYVLLALFLFTGIALKIFLNESPFEVRERDYALVGSFYVFAIWIAFGIYGLYDMLAKVVSPKVTMPAVLASALLAAPVLMAKENWDDHDRSGRYTAVAMAKAYLDSCDKNAILFTIGDNDTFPLWYAQEVEGYRTDVRVLIGSYLHADWYIDQMKRQVYDSMPLPISFEHDEYAGDKRDAVLYDPRTKEPMDADKFMQFIKLEDERAKVELNNGQTMNYYPTAIMRIPVDRQEVIKNKAVSPQRYDSIVPYIDVNLPKDALYKARIMMLDIIRNNHWKRPIYFSGGSIDDEDYVWMKDYLQLEGMVYRLVPVKTQLKEQTNMFGMGYIDSDKMFDTVKKWSWGNGNDPDVYIDPETRRNSFNFRANMARLSETLIEEGKIDKAHEIIDIAMHNMPVESFQYYFLAEPFADGYYKTNDQKAARELLDKLTVKYRENLMYYKSLKAGEQNRMAEKIVGDIERYRNLLLIMKDNSDITFYDKHKPAFNKYNALFKRFGRENE